MGIKFTNNAISSTLNSIDAVNTTIVVKAGEGAKFATFSDPSDYQVVVLSEGVNSEAVKVTGRVGDTLTVVRGYEGVARSWGGGTRVLGAVTSKVLTGVINESVSTTTTTISYVASATTQISRSDPDVKYPDVYYVTAATGPTTWAFSTASTTLDQFILELTNGGEFEQTWPGNVKFPGGLDPILTIGGLDILVFYWTQSSWVGFMIGADVK